VEDEKTRKAIKTVLRFNERVKVVFMFGRYY